MYHHSRADFCDDPQKCVVDQVGEPDARLGDRRQPELTDEDEDLMKMIPDRTNESLDGSDMEDEDEDDEEWKNWRVDDPYP